VILSSSDILRILGADAIIRQAARLSVVEGRPGLGTDDSVYIYIDKFPTIDEFEATWKIWVTDNSGMGEYVLNAMTSLLPNFEFAGGHYTTRDFASERTVVKTEAEKQLEQLAAERQSIKEDFSGLQEGLQARLSTVKDGRDGVDGKDGLDGRDGRDGVDGRDGRDLDATEVELFDLKDVDESPIPLEKGQVLTWDGSKWTNLYVRTSTTVGGGGGGGTSDVEVLNDLNDVTTEGVQDGQFIQYNAAAEQWLPVSITPGEGVPEAPMDGDFYVRQNATWVPADQTGGGGDVESVNGQTGAVVLVVSDLANDAGYITAAEAPVQPGDTFSGDYNDLTNKPDIPDATSDLTNDSGFITAADVPPSYDDTALASRVTVNEADIAQLQTDVGNIDGFSGDYNDLTNKPSIPSTPGDIGAATAAQGALADSAIQPGVVNPVYFANQAAFPDAVANHGAVAHSHADGAMFFAHGGVWNRLANASEIPAVNNMDLASLPELP